MSDDRLAGLSAALRQPQVRRRVGAYGFAGFLHAGLLAGLIVLPPALAPAPSGTGNVIEVRLYTVAGGAQAETDAPLFEPPLSGGTTSPVEDGSSPAGEAGSQGDTRSGAQAQGQAEAELEIEPEPAPEPTPVEEPDTPELVEPEAAPEPELAPEPVPAPAPTVPAPPLALGGGSAPADPQRRFSPAVRAAPPQSAGEVQSDAPVATTQPDPDALAGPPRRGEPTFAEILARVETRLDPDDFRMIINFGDGVRATVRESFCLSSSDANRQAVGCPLGPNPDSARLAQFGLMELGEEAPEFLEDMDRLAFQLSTLGADDNQVMRIMTALRESRREAINTPPITRQMERDRQEDNDIPGAP